MRVRLRYFHTLRRIMGRDSEEAELSEGAKVGDILPLLAQRDSRISSLSSSLLFAVNGEHSHMAAKLNDGDEVALMPPFSGG
ncbi:MoaD/ThiS family protein [Candidatus Sumerlaeota bacterium]|nr:MoaD/ThiS family protein [Candidatus Sumerlaeota bacterium]